VRYRVLVLGWLLVACKTQPVGAPSPLPPVSSAVADAALPGTIGEAGGVVVSAGVTITIPEGSVRTPHPYTVTRVGGDALRDWPRGTDVGFVFEPAGKRFRIPATIELPQAAQGGGEVMCVPYAGERMRVTFDASEAGKPYRFHVAELPRRCAVYTPEHASALRAARDEEAAIVDKNNQSHRWEVKGTVCDPHQLVRPNAGKDLREPPGIGGCPSGMAPLPSRPKVCVDRWEAHVVEVLDDATEHTWSPYFNPGALRIRAKSAPGAVPQGYISQIQAGRACAEAGKRMCKDDEWILACRGSKNTQFPYGKEEKRGTCNDHRDQHPAAQYLESADLSVFTKLEHPCISQIPDSLLLTGSKPACTTPEGLFDMVGNLHEWTADPDGTFRGGYYVDTWLNGHGCDYVTTRHVASYWDYSIGFRCCADAK
jgi:Sulfatase-modifying factor enzyme 1